jgi:seryl-tRNA synthetase
MFTLDVQLERTDSDYLAQVQYALTFLSEDVVSYEIREGERKIHIEFDERTDIDEMRKRVDQLLERYGHSEFGIKSVVYFEQKRDLPVIDAWAGMVERRWATPVGEGHVILRGPAARLMALVDHKVLTIFAKEFGAELEIFPSTIKSETLHRCNHFTSFPEHMDFVSHLKQDLDILARFSNSCKETGWSTSLHEGNMSTNDFAVSPSCCYHAYEGMEGWDLEKPGRCLTAILHCHRYEGANHKYMSRLRAFTMREVVWVGHPAYIISNRARAEELIQQWAKDWDLSCTFETANDMFFTDDFAVKASFQRQQQAKRELRLDVPSDNGSISVFSSNFHSTTFGKAFGITVGGRPATSGCIAWGCERWVYALISQFGFDIERWPAGLKSDYQAFTAKGALNDGY